MTIAHGELVPTRTWLADLNGDGRADVFTHRESDNAWMVSYSGSSNWSIINHDYLNPDLTRFGDVTGDGRDDVFTQLPDGRWARSSGGTEPWVVINGGAFQPTTTWVGDLNGDARDDVVAINADWSWAVSYGGTSGWQIINNGYIKPAAAQLVDINGDGKSDIYAAFEDGSWRVSYSGLSAWQVVNNGELDPTRTWLADMDGNGSADVFSLQNLTRWVVSFSATGSWQEINSGYLASDFEDVDSAPETPFVMQTTDPDPDQGAQQTESRAASSGDLELKRYGSGATVVVNDNVLNKITSYHKVPPWLIGRVVGYGIKGYFSTQQYYYSPYQFRIWEWLCNDSGCRRTARNIYVRFVVDWNDGIANHGDLITMYCKTSRGHTCPAWVQELPPYLGPPGPQ